MPTDRTADESAGRLIFTVIALLLTITLLLSAVATVPLASSAEAGPDTQTGGEQTSATVDAGNGSSNTGKNSENDTFESFSMAFESADPEAPTDVTIRWTLSDSTESVEKVQVEITSKKGKPINVFRPGGEDVQNPFTVAEGHDNSKRADIIVDNLSAVELSLKIPPGHCSRVEGVEVTALDDSNDAVADPDIERTKNCTSTADAGSFNVTIDEYDEQVTAGEDINVTATVENTGDARATQDIRFSVNGTEIERTNLTLGANRSETMNFTSQTTQSDVGELKVAVESDDDAANRTVTVTEPAFFTVTIDEHDELVTAGKTVNVTATVENTGASAETQDVRFLIDGTERSRTSLTLAGNQSQTVNFSYETNQSDVGQRELAVESDDDNATRTVNITEPAFFAVSIQEAPDQVAAGEPLTVTAQIRNTGDHNGTQNVTLAAFDGAIVDANHSLQLSPNESVSITLTWGTDGTDVGDGNVTVSSANDTEAAAAEITQPAVDSITATLQDSRLEVGQQTLITVEATYTDGSTRTVTDNATLTTNETAVATVTSDGTVTAESQGSVLIEAVFEGETDSEQLTVEAGDTEESDDSDGGGTDGPDDSDGDGSNDDSSTSNPGNEPDNSDGDSSNDDSSTSNPGNEPDNSGDNGSDGDTSAGDGDSSDPTDDEETDDDDTDSDDDPDSDDPAEDDSDGDSDDKRTDASESENSDTPEDDRTTIAFFPIIGLLLLPMLALSNRDWF
jgi:hypothetical protein